MKKDEVERKFMLVHPPEDALLQSADSHEEILQGYLVTQPGEMRLRLRDGRAFLTVKGDGGLVRSEWETEIPLWVFEHLWPLTEGRRISKIRYAVGQLEVDQYRESLEGLWVLECEFRSQEDAAAFSLPEWAADAVEVTSDKFYKNKELATRWTPPPIP